MTEYPTEQRLNFYARIWEAEKLDFDAIRFCPESEIIRYNAVMTAWVNLDMRYRTYAEQSWTTEVLYRCDIIVNTDQHKPDDDLWLERETAIIKEVELQMDIAHTKKQNLVQEKES
jgi:hypothetical protein